MINNHFNKFFLENVKSSHLPNHTARRSQLWLKRKGPWKVGGNNLKSSWCQLHLFGCCQWVLGAFCGVCKESQDTISHKNYYCWFVVRNYDSKVIHQIIIKYAHLKISLVEQLTFIYHQIFRITNNFG